MKTQIEILQEQLALEFDEHQDTIYQDNFEDNEYYQVQIEDYDDYLKSVDIDNIDISWLANLSYLHQEYAIFKNEQDLKEEAISHISKSAQYGYLALDYGSKACGCFKDKNPFIIQNKAVFMMSNLLLTSNINEFKIIANHLIDSLNGKSCIIKKGYKQSTISALILQMVSKYLDKPIELHELLQVKLESPHKDIIDNFDTKNIIEVQKLINLMCDVHIDIAKENYEIHYEEQYGEDPDYHRLKYKELFLVGLYQLPFEVLVWLKLRELKGLENPDFKNTPKEMLHPLLQTNISKLYLSLDKVELNNNLIYANKLIEELNKNCNKFKEYEDSNLVKEEVKKEKTISIIKDTHAPKTGNYQALLPNNHPKIEKIKINPHAYSYYEKDDKFIYDGLEEYEENLISWIFLKE